MFNSERLRNLRLNSGKTQRDLSKMLGITEGSYAHYESARRTPKYEIVQKLAVYFNVDENYLYGEDLKEVDKVRELINDLMSQGIIKNAEDINGDIAGLILEAVKSEIRMTKLKELNKSKEQS